MKRILAALAVLVILGLPAAAQTSSVMTTDHPLYGAKMAGEVGVENLAPNATAKADAKLSQATERTREMKQLAVENKTGLVNRTAQAYNQEMQEVNDLGSEVSSLAQQRKIDELIATATTHHAEVLSKVYERVPDAAKQGIRRALNNSVSAHRKAVQAMERRGQSTAGIANISKRIPADVRQKTGIGGPGGTGSPGSNTTGQGGASTGGGGANSPY